MDFVVVGGGISGLLAARTLHAAATDAGLRPCITLLEAGEGTGGALQTVRDDGLLLELGPDSLVATKPAGIELAAELGVPLVAANPGGRTWIVRDGRLLPLPEGLRLLAPTSLTPFLASGTVSWPGKLRMGLDLVLPRRRFDGDESLAALVRRRLGEEALERLAQPMIAGIFSGDPERLSVRATMPVLHQHEQRHGSLIRGMRAAGNARSAGAAYNLFQTPRDGFGALADALAKDVPATVETGVRCESIEGGERWTVRSGQRSWSADALVVALPVSRAAPLVTTFDPALGGLLAGVPTASVATVNLVWPTARLPELPDAFGFVVPAVERRGLVAATFTSRKYPGRSDPDRFVLRAFVGGALQPQALDQDDDALLGTILRELGELLGITAEPDRALVTRWRNTQPQYVLGHPERADAIDARLAAHPTLALLGNAYRGVGIADCVRRARSEARSLVSRMAPELAGAA